MNAATKYPKTLIEAVRYFSDLDIAHAFFVTVRWPDNVVRCPHCGAEGAKYLANYRRYECKNKHAKRQFTVKVGTIMEDSPMSLDKWAVAFWLEANAKNSISSYEIHRALGITQKSAWFMQHRIRLAMQAGSFDKLGGEGSGGVEADETYIGGKAEFMHASKRKRVVTGTGAFGSGKAAVMGLLERHAERGSRVRTHVITSTSRKTIQPIIRQHVEPGTPLYTDALSSYRGMEEFIHQFIDHAEKYVEGNVHTNGLENFWSLFKRCIKGTHVSVDPAHLFRYLDAECFRFNNRGTNDAGRFLMAVDGIVGKRVTYKELIGSLESSPASDKGEEFGN